MFAPLVAEQTFLHRRESLLVSDTNYLLILPRDFGPVMKWSTPHKESQVNQRLPSNQPIHL